MPSRTFTKSSSTPSEGWSTSGKKVNRVIIQIPQSMAGFTVLRLAAMRQEMNEIFGRGNYRFEWRSSECLLLLHGTKSHREHMQFMLRSCFDNFNRSRKHRSESFTVLDTIPTNKPNSVKKKSSDKKTGSRFDVLKSNRKKKLDKKMRAKQKQKTWQECKEWLTNEIKRGFDINSSWADC